MMKNHPLTRTYSKIKLKIALKGQNLIDTSSANYCVLDQPVMLSVCPQDLFS